MKFAYFFLLISSLFNSGCALVSPEESPKCMSCNIFLKKRGDKKFDLVFKKSINSNDEKLLISSVKSIYGKNCYFIIERHGLYSAIHVTNSFAVDKIDFRNYDEALTYFRKNISEDQNLRFVDCNDLYNILLPRSECN